MIYLLSYLQTSQLSVPVLSFLKSTKGLYLLGLLGADPLRRSLLLSSLEEIFDLFLITCQDRLEEPESLVQLYNSAGEEVSRGQATSAI